MKIKKLTTAIALTTIAVSGTATADNITAALAQGKVSGEAYGAYRIQSFDDGTSSVDKSDGDIDKLRLGFNANVMENVEFGIEIQFDAGESAGDSSSTTVRDLFLAKTYGDFQIIAGRSKQGANREAAIEESDRIIVEGVAIDTSGFSSADNLLQDAVVSGLMSRRIDGVEVRYSNEMGLNGTAAIYKAGVDNTGSDMDRSFGFSGSVGWQGGDDDLQFGVSVSAFQEDGDEFDAGNGPDLLDGTGSSTGDTLDSLEFSGFGINANGSFGPVVATLNYFDQTIEADVSGASAEDIDADSIVLTFAVDLGGAQRAFDSFGILGAATGANGSWGLELGASVSQSSVEFGTEEWDLDQYAIGINAYHGANKKLYLQYVSAETDFNAAGIPDHEADQVIFGGRIDF